MTRYLLLGSCLLVTIAINAQRDKIKFGIIGLPFNSAGFAIGTIGYERLNEKLTASWQAHLNAGASSFAADDGTTTRKWITLERTFYFKTVTKRTAYSFSAFTEIGNRIITPGYAYFPSDSILKKTAAFEINPGVNLGLHYKFSEIWGLEIQAGPKMIFASRRNHYINANTRKEFKSPDNEIRPGFLLTGGFYFQL